MIEITNSFHGTSAKIKNLTLSRSTVRRIKAKLCPNLGCQCGGNLSERGKQCVEIEPHQDGSITLIPND